MKTKKIYETLVPVFNQEEQVYNNKVQEYIADRIKEIKIDNIKAIYDDRSYSEVV